MEKKDQTPGKKLAFIPYSSYIVFTNSEIFFAMKTLLKFFIGILSVLSLSGNSFAGEMNGTWKGTAICDGEKYFLEIVLQETSRDNLKGEIHYRHEFGGGSEEGSHLITGRYIPRGGHWKINRGKWIRKIPRGYRFSFKASLNRQGDTLFISQGNRFCKPFDAVFVSRDVFFSGRRPSTDSREQSTRVPQENRQQTQREGTRRRRSGGRTNQRAGRRGFPSEQPQPGKTYDIPCGKIIAWSEQVEKDYPKVDFRTRPYHLMADLFQDHYFVPVFGRSFRGMGKQERIDLWNKTISPCFKPTKENEYNWQRQEMRRAFWDLGLQFSSSIALRFIEMKRERRDWLAAAMAKLNQPGNTDPEEIKELINEGRLRYIGLGKSDKAAFKEAIQKAGHGFKQWDVDPAATHVAIPESEGPPVPRDQIIRQAKSVAGRAGKISQCDIKRAGEIKSSYLQEINRLYPEKLDEAEELFDEAILKNFLKETSFLSPPKPKPKQSADSHIYNPREERQLDCPKVVLLNEEGLAPSLELLFHYVASDGQGNPMGPAGPPIDRPVGFILQNVKGDDPEELFPVPAKEMGYRIESLKKLRTVIRIGLGTFKKCNVSPKENYLAAFDQIVEQRLGIPPPSKQPLPRTAIPCDQRNIRFYQTKMPWTLDLIKNSPLKTRSELAEKNASRIRTEPKYYDPELYARIKGEPEEINTLGRKLQALQAGMIWHYKYTTRYQDLEGREFRRNIKIFWKRRELDAKEAKKLLIEFITDKSVTFKEFREFMYRHLSLRGDTNLLGRMDLAGRFAIRKLELEMEEEFQEIVARNEGKPKAAGAVGEVEIMQAYVNSRKLSLNFQRVLSGHSISFQLFFNPSVPYMITTINSAKAHSCSKIKPNTYDCVFSMDLSNRYSSFFEKIKRQKNDASMILMEKMLKRQSYSKDRAIFKKGFGGWISPTFMKAFQENLGRVQKSLDEQRKRMEETQVELPPDP